jgi:hypothetical protein
VREDPNLLEQQLGLRVDRERGSAAMLLKWVCTSSRASVSGSVGYSVVLDGLASPYRPLVLLLPDQVPQGGAVRHDDLTFDLREVLRYAT